MRTWLAVLLLAIGLLAGCGRPASPPRDLTVAAASDLQSAFTEIGQAFEAETGTRVVFSFGSSGTLSKQIENGAPFDLFAAANVAFVDVLREKGLVVGETQQMYAMGRLVLATNKEAGGAVTDLQGLLDLRIKKVAIANPDLAPYGYAAREALQAAGVWEQIQPKLVTAENVRQVFQFVQTGNAEAGLISHSMAGAPELNHVPVDQRLFTPLRQAMAVVSGSPNEEAARRFAAFVTGEKGRAVLSRHGFGLPEGN